MGRALLSFWQTRLNGRGGLNDRSVSASLLGMVHLEAVPKLICLSFPPAAIRHVTAQTALPFDKKGSAEPS